MAHLDSEARREPGEINTGSGSGICVVSYSHTGNNDALADLLARGLGAERRHVTETRRRSMTKIILDVMLKRTPRIKTGNVDLDRFDLVVFVGPVWMGQVATPFRSCFAEYRARLHSYAFITICGGADGNNPGLEDELRNRLGRDPAAVVELHIADLLPSEPKPQRKDTMAYRLTGDDVAAVAGAALKALNQ